MRKELQGMLAGIAISAIVTGGVTYAANTTTLYDVVVNGIKIVIDGQKINPTDANGNTVEPIIYNGTTYLPVRAIANAFGKAVYWDGANMTVYLGNMNGTLEYPSKELSTNDSIGVNWVDTTEKLKDNYGNVYSRAIYSGNNISNFEYLCNYKYSRLCGTIYVANGYNENGTAIVTVKTDGKTIYTSNELNKKSKPINLDINITGCNDLEIICSGDMAYPDSLCIGNLGLYQ